MSNSRTMSRKEKAGEKIAKRQRKLDKVEYEILENDIIFRSGQYLNQSVKELFSKGPIERDYVVRHLWFTNDPAVVAVINSLCAQ